MSASPTARTLEHVRKIGYDADVVEKWIPGANIRKDFAGCIDVIAFGPEILGIQATSATNHAARKAKAEESPRLVIWLRAGGKFEVWSWRKVAGRWTVRRERLFYESGGLRWQSV